MRRAAVPFVLVLGSVILYFLLATGFGIYQRFPVAHYVGCIVGSIWLVALFFKERTPLRAVVTLIALTLTGSYLWYTLSYSSYSDSASGTEAPHAIQPGRILAELATLELTDSEGIERAVIDPEETRATLLIFYRGHW